MGFDFWSLNRRERRRLLIDSAMRALKDQGYKLKKKPGRGPLQVYWATRDGKTLLVSIRTTKNRRFAFPPLKGGWKTLDDVDLVVVSSVDDTDDPQNAEVYLFSSQAVREKLNAEYAVRTGDGYIITEEVGLWICLDPIAEDYPGSAGSGLADDDSRIAVFPLSGGEVSSSKEDSSLQSGQESDPIHRKGRIADILFDTRKDIANIAGVDVESVKLELSIEV